MKLLTKRLALRTWRNDDLASVIALDTDADVMRFLGGVTSREASEAMLARLIAHWDARGFGAWVVESRETAAFVGFAGIVVPRWESKFTPCVEILWRFRSSEWGRGLATEAARAALDDGFTRHDFREVLAFTVLANKRSWSVMERLGMTRSLADDFDHPLVAEDDPGRRHITYRITREAWSAR